MFFFCEIWTKIGLRILSTKYLLNVTTINWEPKHWDESCFYTNLMKFYIWTINWVTRYINCYCSFKGCRNLTTTMNIGHKFRHQNRRQSLTCSHRPKHMRKQIFLKGIQEVCSWPDIEGHLMVTVFWSISLTMRLLNSSCCTKSAKCKIYTQRKITIRNISVGWLNTRTPSRRGLSLNIVQLRLVSWTWEMQQHFRRRPNSCSPTAMRWTWALYAGYSPGEDNLRAGIVNKQSTLKTPEGVEGVLTRGRGTTNIYFMKQQWLKGCRPLQWVVWVWNRGKRRQTQRRDGEAMSWSSPDDQSHEFRFASVFVLVHLLCSPHAVYS